MLTGCNLTGITEGRGLVPGLFEQIYDLNPVEMTRAVSKTGNIGSNVCKEMTLPVGSKIYDTDELDETWTWETKCTASHHTMTETTNKNLNKEIRNKNKHIPNARLPGPLQIRENFTTQHTPKNNSLHSNSTLVVLMICISSLVFIRS